MFKFDTLEKEYRDKLFNNDSLYKRKIFNQIDKDMETKNIVLIGLRQVGKTTLGEQLVQSYFDKMIKNNNLSKQNNDLISETTIDNYDDVLYLNLKSLISEDFSAIELQKFITNGKYKVVFIDEVQMINSWSNFAQSIIDLNKDTRFLFAGSNALSLNNEMMVNRAKIFWIKPLLFLEYKKIWNDDSENNISNYLQFGSYPKSKNYDSVKIQYQELTISQIIDKIINDDIYEKINTSKFKNLMKKIINIVGSEAKNTSLSIESGISRPTVAEYLKIMTNSQLIHRIGKYNDISDKARNKIYLEDKSMIHLFKNSQYINANNEGSLIENIVFNYLDFHYGSTINWNNITYFRNGKNKEINFIVENEKKIIEVKFYEDLNEEEITNNLNNVIGNLFKDYEKIIITKNISKIINGWKLITLKDILEGKYEL